MGWVGGLSHSDGEGGGTGGDPCEAGGEGGCPREGDSCAHGHDGAVARRSRDRVPFVERRALGGGSDAGPGLVPGHLELSKAELLAGVGRGRCTRLQASSAGGGHGVGAREAGGGDFPW